MPTAIQTYAPWLFHVIPDIRSTGHFDSRARVIRTSGWQVQSPCPSQEWDITINLLFTFDTIPDECQRNMVYITNYICWQIAWTKWSVFGDYAVRRPFLAKVLATQLKRPVPSNAHMAHPTLLLALCKCRVWLGWCGTCGAKGLKSAVHDCRYFPELCLAVPWIMDFCYWITNSLQFSQFNGPSDNT